MPKISSNTLFHFTNSATNLIQIVKSGFSPRFCLESFGAEFLLTGKAQVETAFPMTCFCDLPLSSVPEHIGFYGHYGIGLTKSWGEENGLTPLTYIHKKSAQLKHLSLAGYILWQFCSHFKVDNILPPEQNPKIALLELASFFKPYRGKMLRNGKYFEKCFYDEKEWRYVPFNTTKRATYRMTKDDFVDEVKRAAANENINKKYRLRFGYSDIRYLIVNKESEKISLSDAISRMNRIYASDEIKCLKTKIISTEQILEDF